jgi:hypothetical protein
MRREIHEREREREEKASLGGEGEDVQDFKFVFVSCGTEQSDRARVAGLQTQILTKQNQQHNKTREIRKRREQGREKIAREEKKEAGRHTSESENLTRATSSGEAACKAREPSSSMTGVTLWHRAIPTI